jgi:polyhydroxybutyrate depolymerase
MPETHPIFSSIKLFVFFHIIIQYPNMQKRYLALICTFASFIFSLTGCIKKDNSSETQYRTSSTIVVDGRARSYTLNLPPDYYDGSDFSLVIALHGGGGTGEQFEKSSRLTEKANAAKFAIVYPDGVQSPGLLKARTWNAGACCDYASENKINDVKFISELIDKLVAAYKINPKKVYATGHSNGGMMSYRLACEISHKIAAIAPNASTMVMTQPCTASRPVPILHMHSILDKNVPYTGGSGSGVSKHYNPPIDSVLNVWQGKNQCAQPARVMVDNSRYTFTKWYDCLNNVSIHYYLTKDGGHSWPGGMRGIVANDEPSTVITANDLIWEFFQQYQLP